MVVQRFVATGHVTLDHLDGDIRPGGAALYAGLTAHRLGCSVGVLTSFGPDFPADIFPPDVHLETVPSPQTTAFRRMVSQQGRTLTLLSRADDLEVGHLPAEWRQADLALLCPVANEVDPYLSMEFPEGAVGAAAQGWLRERGARGEITPARWEDASLVLPHLQALIVSQDDVGPFEGEVMEWFQHVPLGVVTLGSRGAHLFVNGERYTIQADPADEADGTGAGDVFAAAFLIEYQRVGDAFEAAHFAACAASLRVEGQGIGAIPSRTAVERRLAAYQRRLVR